MIKKSAKALPKEVKPTQKSVPKPTKTDEPEETKKNRNLLFLGLASIGVALATTSISLLLYHNSGDIYLDRSRPGFLPDEDEAKEQQTKPQDFSFSSTGSLNPEVLQEYLDNYQTQLEALDKLEKPFSSTPLSDASLGIE